MPLDSVASVLKPSRMVSQQPGIPEFVPPRVTGRRVQIEGRVSRGDWASVILEDGLLGFLCTTAPEAAHPPARGTHPMTGVPLGVAVEAGIVACGGSENGIAVLRACEARFESPVRMDEALDARAEVASVGARHVEIAALVRSAADGRDILTAKLVLVRVGPDGRAEPLADVGVGNAVIAHSTHPPTDADDLLDEPADLMRAAFEIEQAGLTEEELRVALAARIEQMLASGFEQLLAALYRMDVDEGKAQPAFLLREPPRVAAALANLVLERHAEKRRTRGESSY